MKRKNVKDRKAPQHPDEAWKGGGLLLAGARRLRALARHGKETNPGKEQSAMTADHRSPPVEPVAFKPRELLKMTDRELREVDATISRLLTRKRLLLVLRAYLAGLPPASPRGRRGAV
jgi:hypothetical protein